MRLKPFGIVAVAALLPFTTSAQHISYVDASDDDRLAGKFDMRLGGRSTDLKAALKLVGEDGATRFMPSITSSWAPVPRLDMRTVVRTGDLNTESARTSVDTRFALEPALRYVERVETSLLRASDRSRESLRVRFARFDTGLGLFGGKALDFRTDMQHERSGERSVTSSSVTSTFGLGDAVSMQSALKLDDRAGGGIERSAIDTRIVYTTPFGFAKSVEGEVHRGHDGGRQSLALQLSGISRETDRGGSYAVSGKALVREVLLGDGAESRRVGFETKFSGVFPTPFGGRNALSLKVERGLGREDLRHAALSYDHAWTPTEQARIELKLKTRRRGDRIEPSMDVNWSARF